MISNDPPTTLDEIHDAASIKTPAVAGSNPCYGTLLNGGTSSDEDILVIQCGGCSAKNLVPLGKDVWYAVFCGVGVGVQQDLVSLLPLNICPLLNSNRTLSITLPRVFAAPTTRNIGCARWPKKRSTARVHVALSSISCVSLYTSSSFPPRLALPL